MCSIKRRKLSGCIRTIATYSGACWFGCVRNDEGPCHARRRSFWNDLRRMLDFRYFNMKAVMVIYESLIEVLKQKNL